MTKQLKEFDWNKRESNYTSPLDKYLDGSIYQFDMSDAKALGNEAGTVYTTLFDLKCALYNRAKYKGLKFSYRTVGDTIVVTTNPNP